MQSSNSSVIASAVRVTSCVEQLACDPARLHRRRGPPECSLRPRFAVRNRGGATGEGGLNTVASDGHNMWPARHVCGAGCQGSGRTQAALTAPQSLLRSKQSLKLDRRSHRRAEAAEAIHVQVLLHASILPDCPQLMCTWVFAIQPMLKFSAQPHPVHRKAPVCTT